MKLSEQIEHFEKHQLEDGDEYGAEVLHHANERNAQLEEELDTYRHEVSVLRQLLDDDGALALKALEQLEEESAELKRENDGLLEERRVQVKFVKTLNRKLHLLNKRFGDLLTAEEEDAHSS